MEWLKSHVQNEEPVDNSTSEDIIPERNKTVEIEVKNDKVDEGGEEKEELLRSSEAIEFHENETKLEMLRIRDHSPDNLLQGFLFYLDPELSLSEKNLVRTFFKKIKSSFLFL